MKGYALVDITTNMVMSVVSWGDSDIPEDYPLSDDQYLLEMNEDIFKEINQKFLKVHGIRVKNKLGLLPDEIFEEINESLDEIKFKKKEEMNQRCEEAIIKGFTASNGHIYRTNRDDQSNMLGQKDELDSIPTITTVSWKTEDVGYITHTREEWMKVYREAFNHKKTQLFKYDSLKKDIVKCITAEEVESIKW